VRRFAMLMLSLSLTLSLTGAQLLFAQDAPKDEAKKSDTAETKPADTKPAETKPAETKPADTKAAETKPAEATKEEPKKEEPLKPIPPEVEAKRQAALKAIAEYIVAAQDAGVVQTSINPPPILDLLITEVFGAWFTGYGKTELSINPENDVRIIPPSLGLKTWYDQRSSLLTAAIEAVRKTKPAPAAAPAAASAPEAKKEEPKKEESKKEEPAKK
jgi:hypothetical protein